MQTFVIPGRLEGLNKVIEANRTNRYKGAQLKREQQTIVVYAIRRSGIRPVKKPCSIVFNWYERDRRRDLDNIYSAKKFILDAMKQAGIIKDDSQRWVIGLADQIFIDQRNPRIEVEIYET